MRPASVIGLVLIILLIPMRLIYLIIHYEVGRQ
jgi:hypothetical protein